ncbi:hypothetical protein HGRIS_007950 [Hohenbuehelia grisea]|uniref:Uncharacterized protein n=1 Tax=Hohenbuehelia grisea TaxID=104357 RepID=A0ABR3J6E9_9AGAR
MSREDTARRPVISALAARSLQGEDTARQPVNDPLGFLRAPSGVPHGDRTSAHLQTPGRDASPHNEYTGEVWNVTQALATLDTMPRRGLHRLSLKATHSSPAIDVVLGSRNVVLPSLRALDLVGLASMLKHLQHPALTELSLVERAPFDLRTTLDLFTNDLRHLSLDMPGTSLDTLIIIFSCAPNIEHLELRGTPACHDVLRWLIARDPPHPFFLPRLKTLCIDMPVSPQCDDSIVALVRSRSAEAVAGTSTASLERLFVGMNSGDRNRFALLVRKCTEVVFDVGGCYLMVSRLGFWINHIS